MGQRRYGVRSTVVQSIDGQLGGLVVRRAAEFSAPTSEIPHIPLFGGGERLETSVFSEIPPLWLAQVLPLGVASITCFEQLSFRSC
jgi:hypothetical protein